MSFRDREPWHQRLHLLGAISTLAVQYARGVSVVAPVIGARVLAQPVEWCIQARVVCLHRGMLGDAQMMDLGSAFLRELRKRKQPTCVPNNIAFHRGIHFDIIGNPIGDQTVFARSRHATVQCSLQYMTLGAVMFVPQFSEARHAHVLVNRDICGSSRLAGCRF